MSGMLKVLDTCSRLIFANVLFSLAFYLFLFFNEALGLEGYQWLFNRGSHNLVREKLHKQFSHCTKKRHAVGIVSVQKKGTHTSVESQGRLILNNHEN